MGSTVIAIPEGDERPGADHDWKQVKRKLPYGHSFREEMIGRKYEMRKAIHSVKVGVALVLVSLIYLVNPLYNQVGENAIWAIMTVVVIFEFSAGATLSKGINRGIGTIIGGGLGCLAAAFAQALGDGAGNAVLVGISIFVVGAGATYGRQCQSIKKRYDYGAMIFILTFNMLAISGLHGGQILEQARRRLSTVAMGFAICIFISLLLFPIWAGDEVHISIAKRFEVLAEAIQGCLERCFENLNENESQLGCSVKNCKSILHSKARDEQLVNFARWEPWHGRFGYSYPWKKYLQVGEVLRDLAASISLLSGTLPSTSKPMRSEVAKAIEETCGTLGPSLAWMLRELGDSFLKMRRCDYEGTILPKLKSMRLQLSLVMLPSSLGQVEDGSGTFAIASLLWSLAEAVHKVEALAKEMDELGQLASFRSN